MIHHSVLHTLRKDKKLDEFFYPYYERFSIAEVPSTILELFGVTSERKMLDFPELETYKGQYKKIIMLMIDGLGYRHFVKYYKSVPFFRTLATHGNVFPITSVFPTTTPAALTTLHTGLTPQEHGLPEWHVYFEEFDSIIETLPFKTWEMASADGLVAQGGTPEMLYEGTTLYQTLKSNHINSYVLLYKNYAGTVYSRSVQKGATVVPFTDGIDMVNKCIDALHSDKGPAYYFLYWNLIDSLAHRFGPESVEHVASIQSFSELMMEEFIFKLQQEDMSDVLVLLTADHGHVSIRGHDIINLNSYPHVDDNFQRSPQGKRILPTGSPHDVFLFIDPKKKDETVFFLKEELLGRADVLTREEALAAHLFGTNKPHPKFLKRIGNVLILPYNDYHVWYEFLPTKPFGQLGIHGGLSEEEMIVPFVIVPLQSMTGR